MYLIEVKETDTGKLLSNEYYSDISASTFAERVIIMCIEDAHNPSITLVNIPNNDTYKFRVNAENYYLPCYITVHFKLLTKIHG